MTLSPDTELGAYKILSPIGAGGMGEVYRARDTKLDRDVAIKVLPTDVVQVPERLARFRREAKLLASLNHPHIASIHGLEEADGRPFLVLELVEGEDLSERLKKGPVPFSEAVDIARQVAEALEAAHEKGVIHRDLKPANVKLTPEGNIKVLDFGLAKAFAADGAQGSASDLSHSPTLTREGTATGVILGTASYMSPEQAKGKAVDRRIDIWAFGCLFYELLTGRKSFGGETVSETLAEILKGEPDWSRLPSDVPPVIEKLLRRCLAKDVKRRLRDIGDAWVMLDEDHAGVAETRPREHSARFVLGAVVIGSLLTGLVMWSFTDSTPSTDDPTRRFVLELGERNFDEPWRRYAALSPDGTRLVYVADIDGTRQLVLRDLDQLEERLLSGTEDADWTFFSPDGEWIGFLTVPPTQGRPRQEGALKKIPSSGGASVTLQEPVFVGTAAWGDDDSIVYQSASGKELQRISSDGSAPQTAFAAETAQWSPLDILPGGDAILATSDSGEMAALSLNTGEIKILAHDIQWAHYVPTGHILYFRRGRLIVTPIDTERLRLAGLAVPIVEGVNEVQWAFSKEGTLVYGLAPSHRLVWVDLKGNEEMVAAPKGHYRKVRVSPDGSRVALDTMRAYTDNTDIWVYELARGAMTRLTLDPGHEWFPLWSRDGQNVLFVSPAFNLTSTPADGAGVPQLLLTSPYLRWPYSWTEGGDLVYEEDNPETGSDIGILYMDGEGTVKSVIHDRFDTTNPAISPDGGWIAYESNESGRVEIYVQRFPQLGEKRQISASGGTVPLWRPDGKELFYRNSKDMMVVPIETEPSLSPGEPHVLFSGDYARDMGRAYDIHPDGDRFLMMRLEENALGNAKLHVVLNWFQELERIAPRAE